MKLLENGKNAFPEIIQCIRQAKRSVYVNMFIWRNDDIGVTLARELLQAANRGVRITLSKDRYGVVLEMAEEDKTSFFHRTTSFSEKLQAAFLHILYDHSHAGAPSRVMHDEGDLLQSLLHHPCVHYEEAYKYDHSKFYVFDEAILILGGINVENKENGMDYAGRKYRDLMVKITDEREVKAFLQQRKDPTYREALLPIAFDMNLKKPALGGPYFGIKERYLQLIHQAEKELIIVMAYLSPLPEFMNEILAACERGVDTCLLIPQKANFQDALNKKTSAYLKKQSGGKIKVFLSPCMVHTKLLMSEKEITFGSSNITKKAFLQLDELNLFAPRNSEDAFTLAVEEAVRSTFAESKEAQGNDLRYPILLAWGEGLLM